MKQAFFILIILLILILPTFGRLRVARADDLLETLSAPANQYTFHFSGLEAVLYHRALSYYNSYTQNYWSDLYDKGRFSFLDWQAKFQDYQNFEYDWQNGGRWWERSWRQSLAAEQGGASESREEIGIGRQLEVLRFGEVAMNNEGKFSFGHLSFYLDAKRSAAWAPSAGVGGPSIVNPKAPNSISTFSGSVSEYGLNIMHSLPELIDLGSLLGGGYAGGHSRGNFYNTEYLALNLKTNLRLGLPNLKGGAGWDGWLQVITVVGLEMDCDIFIRKRPFGRLALHFESHPAERYLQATFNFECFSF